MDIRRDLEDTSSNKEYKVVLISGDIFEFVKEKLGNEVLWVYDEDTKELSIIKKPESFSKALRGLGKEMWKSADGIEYLKQERDSWEG
jgi:hypothetical protein